MLRRWDETINGLYGRAWEELFGIFLNEKGQTLVEYGLVAVLIAAVLILMMGEEINNTWSSINSGINR